MGMAVFLANTSGIEPGMAKVTNINTSLKNESRVVNGVKITTWHRMSSAKTLGKKAFKKL